MYSPVYLISLLLIISFICMLWGFEILKKVDETVPVSEMSDEQRHFRRKGYLLVVLPMAITFLLMCLILL